MVEPNTTPSRGWTPKFIEALKSRAQRYELADPMTPGLVLRVHPSGVRSFRWYVRSLARVVVIGPFSVSEQPAHVTLRQAKDWLARLKEARTAGEAQLNEVLAQLRAHLEPPKVDAVPEEETLGAVAEEFYKRRIVPHRRHPKNARRILDIDILPPLRARSLATLTTRDCAAVVERVVDRGATVHAGKVLVLLKQLLRFAQARGYTDRNPADPLDPKDLGVVSNMSNRALTAEEIPLFWEALDAVGAPVPIRRPDPRTGKVQTYEQCVLTITPATRAALKLLLLTAVRTGELLKARWEHVDFKAKTWTIPVANQKLTKTQESRARPFVIALAPTAIALLQELQKMAGESPWVMASPGAKLGRYTDQALSHAMRRLQEGTKPVLAFPGGPASPHDLRRTARTHLSRLKVPDWIAERVLNHSLGKIVATYDQHDYFDERREALQLWSEYVLRLVDPAASNVIPLHQAGT